MSLSKKFKRTALGALYNALIILAFWHLVKYIKINETLIMAFGSVVAYPLASLMAKYSLIFVLKRRVKK